MTDPRPTTERTKRFTVQAAVALMRKAGCTVVDRQTDTGMIIEVTIPADTMDIHSARMLAIQADNAQST